jgi:hypothetical protein
MYGLKTVNQLDIMTRDRDQSSLPAKDEPPFFPNILRGIREHQKMALLGRGVTEMAKFGQYGVKKRRGHQKLTFLEQASWWTST